MPEPAFDEAALEPDPFRLFARWFEQASALEVEATAVALATATSDGRPSARMVLLKGVDDRGFVFYTNYGSRKSREIAETGRAGLLFYWSTIDRQVRVEGSVEAVSEAESDAYFAARPVESRWSVYASRQSEAIDGRQALETKFEEARSRFGTQVPRPPWWGGYRVLPDAFEFWWSRPNRLHDRFRYVRAGDGWRVERLAP